MIHGLSVAPYFPKTRRETSGHDVFQSRQASLPGNCGEVLGGAGDRTPRADPLLSTSDPVHLGTKLTCILPPSKLGMSRGFILQDLQASEVLP